MRLQMPMAELRALFRKSPAFRQVFLADVATQIGDGSLVIAFPLLIMERTHDVTLTGLAFSGEILAFGLMMPFAGSVADRLEQKTLMITANLARVLFMGMLLVALLLALPAWVFLGLSVALGAAGAFFLPARAAFMRRLLDGEALEKAIAMEGTMGFLMRLVSPPLMGLLLMVLPAAVGLGFDMACYLLAVALLAPAFVTGPTLDRPEAEPAGAWREGWRTIMRQRELRGLLALDTVLSLVGMAAFSITIAFLAEVMHLGAQANGALLAATGLAGAIGAQFAQRLGRWPGVTLALLAAIAATYLLVPTAGSMPVLVAIWALRGLAIGVFCVLINQRIARLVAPTVMGRVHAAWGLAACLAAFGGSAMTPLLLRTLGASRSYTLLGLMLTSVLAVALIAALARRLRPAETPALQEA